MKNIVIHEKQENGKMLLLATSSAKVLYDERECQIDKPYKKRTISDDKKEFIAFKLSKQEPIPIYNSVSCDELVSHLYYDCDKCEAVNIIVSKNEPFACIMHYYEVSREHIENGGESSWLLKKSKNILKHAIESERDSAVTYTYSTGSEKETIAYFECKVCGEKLYLKGDVENGETLHCKCEAKWRVEHKKVLKTIVKEM